MHRCREILLPWATARPETFIIRRSQPGRGAQDYTEDVHEFPIIGQGLHWEADAVARCIRGAFLIHFCMKGISHKSLKIHPF